MSEVPDFTKSNESPSGICKCSASHYTMSMVEIILIIGDVGETQKVFDFLWLLEVIHL
jgi:hypothetical protein